MLGTPLASVGPPPTSCSVFGGVRHPSLVAVSHSIPVRLDTPCKRKLRMISQAAPDFDPTVYTLVASGLSLECEPPLPFDIATYSTQSSMVEGRLESVMARPSLLEKTHERHSDNLRRELGNHQIQVIQAPLLTISAGLLRLAERELIARGEKVSVVASLRRPEKFSTESNSPISRFIAGNNNGVIRYAGCLPLKDVVREIADSFPNASIAIVAMNSKVAESIAGSTDVCFFVKAQYRTFTEAAANSRVLVGACSPLDQTYLYTYSKDLVILTDPRLCNHEQCEKLLFHPHANPRIFVLEKETEETDLKVGDRVMQYVGAETLTIGPGNLQKSQIDVSYRKITTLTHRTVVDEVSMLHVLERSKERNAKIAKVARRYQSLDSDSMSVVLCASASHAQHLGNQLRDWTYVFSSHMDGDTVPPGLRNRAMPDHSIGSKQNVICTTASLEHLPSNLRKLTIIWAGLRPQPFSLPTQLSWMKQDSPRSIEVIDIQDTLAVSRNKDKNKKASRSTVSASESDVRTSFNPLKCLKRWNENRRVAYESRDWWPSGQDPVNMRLDAAGKRLVLHRNPNIGETANTTGREANLNAR